MLIFGVNGYRVMRIGMASEPLKVERTLWLHSSGL